MEELGCKLSISLKWGCRGDVRDLRPISPDHVVGPKLNLNLKVCMVCPGFP